MRIARSISELIRPLERKLPLLIAALLCFVVATFGWLVNREMKRAFETAAGERLSVAAQRLASMLTESGGALRLELRRLAADPTVIAALMRPDAATIDAANATLGRSRSGAAQPLSQALWTTKCEMVTAAGPLKGSPILGTCPVAPRALERQESGNRRDWVQPLVAHGDSISYAIVARVLAGATDTMGYLMQVRSVSGQQSGRAVSGLIGKDVSLLVGNASGPPVWTDFSKRTDGPPLRGARGVPEHYTPANGTPQLGVALNIVGTPWVVWVQMPVATILDGQYQTLRKLAIIALMCIVIGVLGAWGLGRHVTRPLAELTRAAEDLARGNYSRRVTTMRRDELGHLMSSFNRMASEIEAANHVLQEQAHELEVSNQELNEAADENRRRQAAEHLATASSLRLQTVLDSATETSIIATDERGLITVFNRGAERMLGYAAEEVVGKQTPLVIHDVAEVEARGQELSRQLGRPVQGFGVFVEFSHHRAGELETHDWTYLRKDGTRITVVLTVSPIVDSAGHHTGFLGVATDVTEQRRTERALQTAMRASQLIMQHSMDVICTIDGQGRFAFVSAASERLLGYTPEDLVGRPYIDLVDPGDHAKTNQAAADVMAGMPVREFENRYRRKDGSLVPIVWSASWSEPDQLMFCVAHDDTERKRTQDILGLAHDELRRANSELARASQLKDEFLANMSHELRTPLNAILGLSETLLEQLADTATARQLQALTTIATSGQHLLALINDILDLSKIEAGKLELNPETLNVSEFCESCLAFVRSQAMQKHIGVAVEHDGRVATLVADPKRLKQVLVNLLTNAVKFTPVGGRIGLTVAAPEGEEVVRFTVWDTGIGIAPAAAARLFRAFTQLDSGLSRDQEGTGLGLALVAKLAELHGGGVALESAAGQGSRFIVTLPRRASAPAPAVAPVSRGETDRRSYRHALVIEDDPTAGAMFVKYLTELGLSSVVLVRGEEAVEAVVRERPDVILLDILLPGESGWVVLTRLKEHPGTRDVPVVVVSVVDEPQKSHALGAAAHFTKPVTRGQLADFFQRPARRALQRVARSTPAPSATGPLLLLAEDNAANIQTIGGYLEDKGYVMLYAMTGLEAVQLARTQRPALILMDIQMPVMDGLMAIQEIRADVSMQALPIVALTALAMAGDRERCLAAGATEYLSKPVHLKGLAALVSQLVPQTGVAVI